MDTQTILDIIDQEFKKYKSRRLKELLATQKGAARMQSNEEIRGTLGKAVAADELRHTIFNALGRPGV
jgi:hypothetical protein